MMHRRTLLRLLKNSAIALGLSRFAWADPPPSRPKHWVWVSGVHRKPDEWRRKFEQLKRGGIDAILPEVYNSRRAYFAHSHPAFASDDRTLEELIPLAHEFDVEVHAWMWTVPCNNRQIVSDHPEWYAINGKAESAATHPAYVGYYKFLCPRQTDVRQFIAGTVDSLGKIDGLDGIHLDYVRLPDVILAKGLWKKYDIVQDREYPQYDYCYCETCRAAFKKSTGIDPLQDLDDPSANAAWKQFRHNSVTELVNDHLVPIARKYDKQITAAVFPNWQNVRQEWHRWQLDAFLPMLYHTFYEADIAWIGEQVAAARSRLQDKTPIYAGLFLPSLDPAALTQAVQTSRAAGAAGVALFNLGGLRAEHFSAMRQAAN